MTTNKQQCLIISHITNFDKQMEKGEKFDRAMKSFKQSVYKTASDVSLVGDISVIYLQFEYDSSHLTGRSGKRVGRLDKKGKSLSAYIEVTTPELERHEGGGLQTFLLGELIEVLGMIERKLGSSQNGISELVGALRKDP